MMRIQRFRNQWNHQDQIDILTDLDEQTIIYENCSTPEKDSDTFKIFIETVEAETKDGM